MRKSELRKMFAKIESVILFAPASDDAQREGCTGPSEPIYAAMNSLGGDWIPLSGPTLHGNELAIVMVRVDPETD